MLFGIEKNFIKNDFFNEIFSSIKLNKDDVIIDGKVIKELRETCWVSDFDYLYRYGGKLMYPQKLSNVLKKIQLIIELRYGKYFDSILINYYKSGQIGMRYHSDSTYDEWEEESVIVSFGSSRIIKFRDIENIDDRTEFQMESGDLIFMKSGCQKKYQHCVCKNKKDEDRISLVFKKHV